MAHPNSGSLDHPKPLIRGRTSTRRWLVRSAQLAVLIAILWLAWRLFEHIGWRQLWLRMKGADEAWMIGAVATLVARFVFLYHRWSLALAAAGFRPEWRIGQTSQLAAVLVNHLAPTARLLGGVLRARYVSRWLGRGFAQVYATVLVDQISQQVVLGLITWIALIAVAIWTGLTSLAIGLSLLLAMLMMGLTLWRRRARFASSRPIARLIGLKAERMGKRLGPLFVGGREIAAILRKSFSDARLQASMAATGILIFALNVAAQSLVFEGLGTHVPLAAVIAAMALGLAAGLLTGTPGGVATTEAAMVGLFVTLGVGDVEATAGVLLYRGLHYLLVLALGLPSLLYCGDRTRRRATVRSEFAEEAPPGSETPAVGSPPDSAA